jgi:hypothetical protein
LLRTSIQGELGKGRREIRKREKERGALTLPLFVGLAGPLGRIHHVRQSLLGLRPTASFEAAIRVDDEQIVRDLLDHGSDAVLNLLLRWDTRRVNLGDFSFRTLSTRFTHVVDTRACSSGQ